MKKDTKQILGFLLGAVLLAAVGAYATTVYTGPLVNESGLAYSKNVSLDLQNHGITSLSAQAAYSIASISTVTVYDGAAGTGTIAIAKFDYLKYVAQPSTNSISITSNSALSGAYITVQGVQLLEGRDWTKAAVASNTAISIASAINELFPTYPVIALSSSTVIHSTITFAGAAGNQYTLTSSTPTAMSVANPTYYNGQDSATFALNGVTLIQGRDWTAATTATDTAKSLSGAINANTSLSSIVISTWAAVGTSSAAIITATATSVGTLTNYSLFSSTPAALVISTSNTMMGGFDSQFLSNSQIYAANSFTTALPVVYLKTSGNNPANLTANTTYYTIPVDATHFKLATTTTNAVNGTNISISTSFATGGGVFKFMPEAYTGTAGFKWQLSNDNTNWVDMSVTSVTYSSPSSSISSNFWDFGSINNRYIRLNIVGPTQGGLYLVVTMNGQNE